MISELLKRAGCSIKNRKLAYFVLCLYALVYGANSILLPAMVTNLEKRFDFSSSQSSYLMAANDIGYILCVFFVAYYGGRGNHVKCLAWSAVGIALAGFLTALPYFIFGNRYPPDELLGISNSSSLSNSLRGGESMTLTAACRMKPSSAPKLATSTTVDIETQKTVAMTLQMIGGIVVGIAATPFWNLGITFLDDIMGRKSGIYIGCLYAIRCVAPTIGFSIAAFFNSVNESLKFLSSSYPPGQRDPLWISAWWIGFVILGGITLFTAPCLAIFNSKDMLRQADEEEQIRRRKSLARKRGEELTDMQITKDVEEKEKEEEEEKVKVISEMGLKDMLKVILSFWKNPIFVTHIIGRFLEVCGHNAIFAFFQKFLEVHFRITASEASMTTALAIGGAAIFAMALSGIISKFWPMSFKNNALFFAVTNLISAAMFPFLILFVCPTVPILGSENKSPDFGCAQQNCSCPLTYKPVCVDNQNYFSACQAGCESYDPISSTYSNCLCKNLTGVPGVCGGKCNLLYYYGILKFISGVFGTVAAVQATQLMMALGTKENKAIGLATVSVCFGVTGMCVPVITGRIISSICLLRNPSAKGKSFCVLYDADKMRVILHLLSFVPQLLACVFYFISWYLAPKGFKGVEAERKKKKEIG